LLALCTVFSEQGAAFRLLTRAAVFVIRGVNISGFHFLASGTVFADVAISAFRLLALIAVFVEQVVTTSAFPLRARCTAFAELDVSINGFSFLALGTVST
jgi:hypothetical protein